jgi:hypothetical protein
MRAFYWPVKGRERLRWGLSGFANGVLVTYPILAYGLNGHEAYIPSLHFCQSLPSAQTMPFYKIVYFEYLKIFDRIFV